MVNQLAHGWLAGRTWPNGFAFGKDPVPTPVPDGARTKIREQLIRLRLTETRSERFGELPSTVPGFTFADGAFATGRLAEAVDKYRVMLTQDPDHAMAWTGLGVTLAAIGTNPVASRALLSHPEVIRGVYRRILTLTGSAQDPDDLATWIVRREMTTTAAAALPDRGGGEPRGRRQFGDGSMSQSARTRLAALLVAR